MSNAASHNISIDQGSDYDLQILIKDELGVPQDLTGHTFSAQIRKNVSDDAIVASFVFVLLDQSITANHGILTMSMSAAVSSAINLPAQNSSKKRMVSMPYDVESLHTGGTKTKRWFEGVASFSPEITR